MSAIDGNANKRATKFERTTEVTPKTVPMIRSVLGAQLFLTQKKRIKK
jgi:hypothetical protein